MRVEFTKKTRVAAWQRADGHCERCGAILVIGKFAFDHINPSEFSGDNSLENIQCLCAACHQTKTSTVDVPAIAKSNRIRSTAAGIRRERKITAWRNFAGEIIRKPRIRE